jgi:hypothetical protein
VRARRIYLAAAIVMTLLFLASFTLIIVAGYVAIFQHSDEWGSAAAFSFLPAFAFGVAGGCLWLAYNDLPSQP